MRALLLSAYDAGSHRYWRESLATLLPDWDWHNLVLPPRHFSWRVRGNPWYWALRERAALLSPADVVVATSMVDLATLRGLVPELARRPTLLYFHENQFAYPEGQGRHGLLEPRMVSLYSALAADLLAFNSAWNRDSFLRGVSALMDRLPDYVPAETPELLAARSIVLPVPVTAPGVPADPVQHVWREPGDPERRPLRIAWVGRLEYDKGADGLERLLGHLERPALDYQLAVVGQRFRNSPAAFSRIEQKYGERLRHIGWLERSEDYHALLAGADVVLSTALHEFQGIAVMEAVLQGCIPVLPARLAYLSCYPPEYLYPSIPADPDAEALGAARHLRVLADAIRGGQAVAPDLAAYSPAALAPRYREVLDELVRAGAGGMASPAESR